MATTRFIDHLLEGDHASRPAAGDVPEGTLYSCTTHSLVYQSDTSTWTTWATLGGSSSLDAIIAASSGEDIADALAGAAAPDAGNVFATMADVSGGGNVSTVNTTSIDQGAATLLQRPAASNTEDDEFDATSLDAKWLAYTGANATANLTNFSSWAQFTTGGAKLQAVPGGDWTIETEVISGDQGAAAYTDSGLIITNGTTQASATHAVFGIGQRNSLQQYRVVFEKFVNGAFSTAFSEWAIGAFLDHYFLRLNKSSTTYTALLSSTGKTWHRFWQEGSIGFTPTHFGLLGDTNSMFNYFVRT